MNKEEQKRMKALFKKHKGLIKTYERTARFKEPVLLLIRNTGEVEFFEGVTDSMFSYEHSDGTERILYLSNAGKLNFPYGKDDFRGYICHEDYPTPLPYNQVATTEKISLAIDKVLADVKEWKAKEIDAKANLYWKIGLIVLALIGAFILYKMLVPNNPTSVTVIKEAVTG